MHRDELILRCCSFVYRANICSSGKMAFVRSNKASKKETVE
uniref:Uncharacterized protein n=1 Tax=Anopheles minimus TaxID=112268 RepID=A0A182WNL5_9DIPT